MSSAIPMRLLQESSMVGDHGDLNASSSAAAVAAAAAALNAGSSGVALPANPNAESAATRNAHLAGLMTMARSQVEEQQQIDERFPTIAEMLSVGNIVKLVPPRQERAVD
eukprot:m.198275 g.198275  ORF g.198275 m.198275 type:complete len:110 (-) comp17674_c0_seq1:7-336(-)